MAEIDGSMQPITVDDFAGHFKAAVVLSEHPCGDEWVGAAQAQATLALAVAVNRIADLLEDKL